MYHALGKQKNGGCQDDKKQDSSNFEPEWPLFLWGCFIQICCHLSYLSSRVTGGKPGVKENGGWFAPTKPDDGGHGNLLACDHIADRTSGLSS